MESFNPLIAWLPSLMLWQERRLTVDSRMRTFKSVAFIIGLSWGSLHATIVNSSDS
jgi:hypothetical protein